MATTARGASLFGRTLFNGMFVSAAPQQPGAAAPIIPRPRRPLSTTAPPWQKQMPARPKPPPDSDLEESYLKGSGPGGQKINKTNSAVQLKHIPTGLVVKCQATRSRDQNRKIARDLLAARLDVMFNGEQSRQAIVADSKRKKKASAAKKSKRKYRKLEGQGEEEDDDAGPELEGALEGSLSESQSTGQAADTTAAAASEKHTSHTAPTT
ncbi:hypothetical protein RB596_008810 [Gaeumannomyces avenae]